MHNYHFALLLKIPKDKITGTDNWRKFFVQDITLWLFLSLNYYGVSLRLLWSCIRRGLRSGDVIRCCLLRGGRMWFWFLALFV